MANVDTHEEFWGITLSGDKKTHAWNPASSEEEVEHKIQVTQACLGHKAKEGERNVVEVTTADDNGKTISCAIVSLRVGFNECMHLELGFTNKVKFVLKEGNGPLSLCGVHLMALPLDLDNLGSDDSSDEEVPQLLAVDAGVKKEGESTVKEDIPLKESDKIDDSNTTEESEEVTVVPDEKEKKEEKVVEKKSKKRVADDEKQEVVSPKKKKEENEKEVTKVEEAVTIVEETKDEDTKMEEAEDTSEDDDEDDDSEDDEEEDDEEEEEANSHVPEVIEMEAKEDTEDGDSESGDEEPSFGDDIGSDDDEDGDEDDEDGEEDLDGFIVGEDSDESGDDDDDDDDDDEDESEDDDESEEEVPQPKKTQPAKPNGNAKKMKQKPDSTAVKKPAKEKPPGKENLATPTKDKAKDDTKDKKGNTGTPKRTPEELKTFLLKSPNLPKKYEKFANFMKNNMKVADAKTQKELWEYIQKNKK